MENNTTEANKLNNNNSKNNKTIIIIAAVIVVIVGITMFRNWQVKRQAQAILEQGIGGFGMDMANIIEKNMENYEEEKEDNDGDNKKETPKSYFNSAVSINISNNEHSDLSNEVKDILEKVFKSVKITGFTSGYMGMNSGSGIVQFTTLEVLKSDYANDINKELTNRDFTVMNVSQDSEGAAIMATKGDYTYTIGYTTDEQEITVLIMKVN